MMMLRSLTVAVGGVLLALAFALSPAPASAILEADLTVSHTVVAPSQVDVNTGFGVQVSVSFRHLGPSQEVAPAVFSYTLTGPPECTPFSRGPSDTLISFGSRPGLSFTAPGFCTTAGVKTFVSRAEFLPGPGVTDANLDNNVSVVTFDVLLVSGDADGDGIPDAQDNCPTVANPDQRPSVAAALVPVGAGDNEGSVGNDSDEGRFRVDFAATNPCGLSLTVLATLSGPGFSIEVTNGQILELELEDDGTEIEAEAGIVEVEAPSFTLTVTATDPFGNVGVATATPAFITADNDGPGDLDD